MNAHDAFYNTVHSYPGGCEALAPRLGIAAGVLRNKANPHAAHNKPTLEDVERIVPLTGDMSILDALAAANGRVLIAIDADAEPSDMAVLELVAKAWSASSDVGAEVYATLADGIVEPHEIARVKTKAYHLYKAVEELIGRLECMAEK